MPTPPGAVPPPRAATLAVGVCFKGDRRGGKGGAMHARMTTIRTQPGKLAEAMDIARGSIAPHAKGQRGFKSLLALVDPEDDLIVFVSLWETEVDLEAGENSGYYRSN